MRHAKKRHRLSKPADQRKALLRTLATSFIERGEIVTTLARAKAVQPLVEKLITYGKDGSVHSLRQAARVVYNYKTGDLAQSPTGKTVPETILRRLFAKVAPMFKDRVGGYTRIVHVPPRRGDAAPMALLSLVTEQVQPKKMPAKATVAPKKAAKKAEEAVVEVQEVTTEEVTVEETVVTEAVAEETAPVAEAPETPETPEA